MNILLEIHDHSWESGPDSKHYVCTHIYADGKPCPEQLHNTYIVHTQGFRLYQREDLK